MRGLVAIVIATLGALAATSAHAGETTSPGGLVQSAEVVHTPAATSTRGQPAATKLHLTFSVRRVDGEPPASLTQLRIRLPRGLDLNARHFPECELARLQAFGASACRRGARIGTGSMLGDARPVVPNLVPGVVTAFNGRFGTPPQRRVLLYMRPSLGPSLVPVGTLARARSRWVLDIRLAVAKILISPFGDSVITRLQLALGASRATPSRRRIAFVENPRRCVAPGYRWIFEGHYADGQTVSTPAAAPCAPPR